MELLRQYLLPTLIVLTAVVLQFRLYRYFRATAWIQARRWRMRALQVVYYALTLYMLLGSPRLVIGGYAVMASVTLSWILAATLLWTVILISGGLWLWLHGLVERRAAPRPGAGASRRALGSRHCRVRRRLCPRPPGAKARRCGSRPAAAPGPRWMRYFC